MKKGENAEQFSGADKQGSEPLKLSPRQAQIAELVAQGLSDCEIAAKLGLAENTVGAYLQVIYQRNGFHSRTTLTARWLAECGALRP